MKSTDIGSLFVGHEVVNSTVELLDQYAVGKNVLDLGCANYYGEYGFGLMHSEVIKRCASCVGVDISENVHRLPVSKGVRYYQADVEDFILSEKFDLIFAGDLIEHLSNIGQFLQCAKAMLNEDGKMVVVTPNPFGLRHLLDLPFRNEPRMHREHTVLLPVSGMQELLSRYGLAFTKLYYVIGQERLSTDSLRASIYKRLYRFFTKARYFVRFADTIAFEISVMK